MGKEPGQGFPVWAYPVPVTRSLIQGAFDSQDVFSSRVGVDHGGVDVGVTEEFLDGTAVTKSRCSII